MPIKEYLEGIISRRFHFLGQMAGKKHIGHVVGLPGQAVLAKLRSSNPRANQN